MHFDSDRKGLVSVRGQDRIKRNSVGAILRYNDGISRAFEVACDPAAGAAFVRGLYDP